jgi:hypothetical protein
MKTIQLDEQTSTNLERLSSERQITPEELIKQLIDELAQQPKKTKTTLEKLQDLARQQGEPEPFLNERPDLSDRDVWKPMLDSHLQEQHQKVSEQS